MYIGVKAWSDFGSHIPLIRSFSLGDNFPPEYPLFPGEPIRYHFLFYALVGFLERLGIPLDYALNIPSAILFAGLLLTIYFFAKALFKSKAVGVLSIAFFLFNGSLSFLEFFKDHPLSTKTIIDIVTNNEFSSFAPYGKGIVSAFWNLNIYTNQRHLAGAYFLSLLLLFFFLKPVLHDKKASIQKSVIIGLVLGLSFFFHMAAFFMTAVVILFCFLVFPKIRIASLIILGVAGILVLPQYLTMQSSSAFPIIFHPGYLIANMVSLPNLLSYWFFNLGLHTILMPLGFLVASKNAKKILLCFIPIFIIGNTIQFSPEIAANHKFFNYFMIIGSMYSAYALVFLWRRKALLRPLVILLFFLLTFSGIIDFFPIYNDPKGAFTDYPVNEDIRWIMDNTPKDAIFLNTAYFVHPVTTAGRKIFLGWPYFAWSQGYQTEKRYKQIEAIGQSHDKSEICNFLKRNSLGYVYLGPLESEISFERNFWSQNFTPIYSGSLTQFNIYKTGDNC